MIREWVIRQVTERGNYAVELAGPRGFVVKRADLPEARAYCAEPSDVDPFTPDDLLQAREEMPGLEYIVVVRRTVAHATYPLADELEIGVGSAIGFKLALASEPFVAQYRSAEHRFVWRRLTGNQYVDRVRRCGMSAYEIIRKGWSRSLRIVTIDGYELTADDVYNVVEKHSELGLDAIVITNQYSAGFPSTLAVKAGRAAGVLVTTFRDFLDRLGTEWT
jgi:hypothetical protein